MEQSVELKIQSPLMIFHDSVLQSVLVIAVHEKNGWEMTVICYMELTQRDGKYVENTNDAHIITVNDNDNGVDC